MIGQVGQMIGQILSKFGVDPSIDGEREGQGLVEYALIIVLVSIACVTLLGTLGTTIGGVFSNITGSL